MLGAVLAAVAVVTGFALASLVKAHGRPPFTATPRTTVLPENQEHDAHRPGQMGQDDSVIEMPPERFAQMVDDAILGLPPELAHLMSNVGVVIEDSSGDPHLLGLYEGVPLTQRSSDYSAVLPDRIVIYRLPICAMCETEDEVVDEVSITVVHEIGHHFGISDERLHELGW